MSDKGRQEFNLRTVLYQLENALEHVVSTRINLIDAMKDQHHEGDVDKLAPEVRAILTDARARLDIEYQGLSRARSHVERAIFNLKRSQEQ